MAKTKGRQQAGVPSSSEPPAPGASVGRPGLRPAEWLPHAERLCGLRGALVVLAVFALLADTSISRKSVTFDEPAHFSGGMAYWAGGQYVPWADQSAAARAQWALGARAPEPSPENGMLPQRWAALPAWLSGAAFPDLTRAPGASKDVWGIGDEFLHDSGNDLEHLLRSARRMLILLAAGLGLLVYLWSRRLFGALGGMLSLLLYALSPNVLANGPLVTADVPMALAFAAAMACLWHVMHRLTPWTALGTALVVAAAFLTKYSAVMLAPMAVLMLLVRIAAGRPLGIVLRLGRKASAPCILTRRLHVALVLLGAGALTAVVSVLAVWAFQSFQHASPFGEPTELLWKQRLAQSLGYGPLIAWAREVHLLPDSWLFGFARVMAFSRQRVAFLNGEIGTTGWWWFFPYAFLVKTPLATLALLGLAVALPVGRIVARVSARARAWSTAGSLPPAFGVLYSTTPLLVLFGTYWAFSLTSHLNIGYRHVLPAFVPMVILAGAVSAWLGRGGRLGRFVVPGLLALLLVESLAARPHYLAYFNPLAGGSSGGYRHLVDSSLDWGQDLPGVKSWIDKRRASGDTAPVFLSYFGTGRPAAYGITAKPLRSYPKWTLPGPNDQLAAGTYLISATMLQGLYLQDSHRGPWTASFEEELAFATAELNRLDASGAGMVGGRMTRERQRLLGTTEDLRFARLSAWLRQREPDDNIGHSILVYELSAADLQAALNEPLAGVASLRSAPVAMAPPVPTGQAAQSTWRERLERDPNDFVALLNLGVELLADPRTAPESVLLLERAAQVEPTDFRPHANLSQAHASLGHLEQAVAACDEALRRRPDIADLWLVKAELLDALGRPDDAARARTEAAQRR